MIKFSRGIVKGINPTITQAHIDGPLTTISVAYMQDVKNFVAASIFPMVNVMKQTDKYFIYDKDAWFRDEAQVRSAGTESAGGDYTLSTDSYECKVYAFHKDLYKIDVVNSDAPLRPNEDASNFVMHKLLLKREILFLSTYFVTGVWGTEVDGVSATPSTGEVLQWNDADSTPIEDITDGIFAMQSVTGYKPNVLLLGAMVFKALKHHPDILDRIKYTQRGVITEDILAALFGVDKIVISYGIKNSAKKGQTEDMDFMAGKHALLAYVPASPSLQTPSAGYIFAFTGFEGASAYGSRIIRIDMPLLGLGSIRIEGEMAFDMKLVAADLGYFFNGVVV